MLCLSQISKEDYFLREKYQASHLLLLPRRILHFFACHLFPSTIHGAALDTISASFILCIRRSIKSFDILSKNYHSQGDGLEVGVSVRSKMGGRSWLIRILSLGVHDINPADGTFCRPYVL